MSTSPDPVAEFSVPILQHMNADHSDTTKAMVQHYITEGVEVIHRVGRSVSRWYCDFHTGMLLWYFAVVPRAFLAVVFLCWARKGDVSACRSPKR